MRRQELGSISPVVLLSSRVSYSPGGSDSGSRLYTRNPWLSRSSYDYLPRFDSSKMNEMNILDRGNPIVQSLSEREETDLSEGLPGSSSYVSSLA